MKKFFCLLLSMMLLLGALPVMAADIQPDELVVGHPTATKGDFFTEMFGNNTADIDVRALIHGYNLVNWDQNQGVYKLDPSVVEQSRISVDGDGNRTYCLVLADDLYFSDGTKITAWDYAFSMLLMMAPEVEAIGGKIYRAEHILGYDEYITGKEQALKGVKVLDDHQLAITLDNAFLPYYYETGLLLCVPYPISVIAPGCKVYDDGEGVYIANGDANVTDKLFTAELLQKTILDPETGYNSHPAVVSGPYTMVSYDGVTAHFELNPYYKGSWFHNTLPDGAKANYIPLTDALGNQRYDAYGSPLFVVKPTIEKIAFTVADYETMAEQLKNGELHIVNKVTYNEAIKEAEGAGVGTQEYPRIGMSFFTFSYELPTVHDMEVRQAIAWCMDRDALTEEYCGAGRGVRMDGYFGMAQWEYLLSEDQMEYPITYVTAQQEAGTDDLYGRYKYVYVRNDEEYGAAEKAWQELSLDNLTEYKVDTAKANALLDEAGWTLNEQGEAYKAGDVRSKMIDGKLVSLNLSLMYPEGNHIVDTLQENFIDNLNEVGIQLTLVPTPMAELLSYYYRETERTTDMIYLATNFHVVIDPSITYSTDTTKNHQIWNNTYSDDEELYLRAVDLRTTETGNLYEYVRKWILFQERYNEVLPAIPLYSNIYTDFVSEDVSNYFITGQVTWSQAIILAEFNK